MAQKAKRDGSGGLGAIAGGQQLCNSSQGWGKGGVCGREKGGGWEQSVAQAAKRDGSGGVGPVEKGQQLCSTSGGWGDGKGVGEGAGLRSEVRRLRWSWAGRKGAAALQHE